MKYLRTPEHENIFPHLHKETPTAALYVCLLPFACAPRLGALIAGGNRFLKERALSRCASWTNSSVGAVQTTVCPVVRLLVSPRLRALQGFKSEAAFKWTSRRRGGMRVSSIPCDCREGRGATMLIPTPVATKHASCVSKSSASVDFACCPYAQSCCFSKGPYRQCDWQRNT